MRRQLAQRAELTRALEDNDRDEPMDAVVRRFWSRTRPSRGTRSEAGAVVVDLLLWAKTRGQGANVKRD